MSPRIKRKRGGQPGNQNARTHGFYSRFLDRKQSLEPGEVEKLDGVEQEIALVRQQILSVLRKDPDNMPVIMLAINSVRNLIREKTRLKKYERRNLGRAVRHILRDTMAVLNNPPETGSPTTPLLQPDSAEAGSLTTNESDTDCPVLR